MRARGIAALVAAVAAALLLTPLAAAHGDSVPADQVWTRWTFEPVPLIVAAAAVALFLQGWLRLRGRGRVDHAGLDRLALFLGGIVVVLIGIVSPLDPIAEEYLQSAHMLQHVLLADIGVALIVLAVRGPLTVFFLPRAVLRRVARSRVVRRAARAVTRPSVTVLLWVSVLVVWHVPSLYEAALQHKAVHDLEHLSFVVVGTLVWIQLIDPLRHGRLTIGERIGLAAVVFWVGQILAYVIVFEPTPLFETYTEQDERLLGLSPLTDQKIAGVLMMVEQMVTVGTCLLVLVSQARKQRAAVPPVIDELPI
jgi:cytochrome c oxidase assembly factor CtaG